MSELSFVAREGELAALESALSATFAGQAQFRFVTGEAGSGKTTLVEEFIERAQAVNPNLIAVAGTCDAQTGASDPHLPFRQILQLLLGDMGDTGATSAENRRRLGGFLRVSTEAVMEIGPELIGLFIPGAGLVAKAGAFAEQKTGWLERLQFLVEKSPPAPGEVAPGRIFEQYTDVLKAMATEQPLMLVLEDLQWADVASLNLLFYLGRNLKDSPMLVLGTYRPAEVSLGRCSKTTVFLNFG